jgi:hypothetical protein
VERLFSITPLPESVAAGATSKLPSRALLEAAASVEAAAATASAAPGPDASFTSPDCRPRSAVSQWHGSDTCSLTVGHSVPVYLYTLAAFASTRNEPLVPGLFAHSVPLYLYTPASTQNEWPGQGGGVCTVY